MACLNALRMRLQHSYFQILLQHNCTYKEERCMQASTLVKVTLIYLSNSCRKGRVLFCHDNDGAFKGLLWDWVSISFCTYLSEQGCRVCYVSFWKDFSVLGSVVGFDLHYSLGFSLDNVCTLHLSFQELSLCINWIWSVCISWWQVQSWYGWVWLQKALLTRWSPLNCAASSLL
jgi:hypothetical protein